MSIGSAVFAQRTVECPINLQWAAIFSPRAHPSHLAKRHLDRFSRFRMGFKCYALSMGENPKIAHWALPFGIASPAGEGPSHGHRQQAQKVVKIARVVREICSRTDRQTDRQTHRHRRAHYNNSPPLLQSCGRSKNSAAWRTIKQGLAV